MSQGRFTLGVGAGEQLNEHVMGKAWPPVDIRHEMLGEAIQVIRLLWEGGYRSFRGEYFTVDDAQVFDRPDQPIPLAVAASGRRSADLAGRLGDGLIAVEPQLELVEGFRKAGGEGKPTWCQIVVCWGEDEEAALQVAHERFRWAPLGWKVMSELPNPVSFDAATATVTPEDMAAKVPPGADVDRYLQAIRRSTPAHAHT